MSELSEYAISQFTHYLKAAQRFERERVSLYTLAYRTAQHADADGFNTFIQGLSRGNE